MPGTLNSMVRLILCRNINDCLWNAAISSLNRFTTSIKRQTEEEEEKKNKRTQNYVPEIQARPGLHASTIAIISSSYRFIFAIHIVRAKISM